MRLSSLLSILGAASITTAAMLRRQVDQTTAQATHSTIATTRPVTATSTPAATTTSASQTTATATYAQGSAYGYTDGTSGGSVDTDAGASGSSGGGGFSLSTGGLIAICIIVAIVAIFGVVTTSLFIIAKRRQWTMRQTLRRASRRLTGRGGQRQTAMDRQSKRVGLQMSAQPARQGHKRGLVVEVNDAEKGSVSSKPSKLNGFGERLWRNDWKR